MVEQPVEPTQANEETWAEEVLQNLSTPVLRVRDLTGQLLRGVRNL